MKVYDFIIYGGGPTGLTLAYILSKNNFNIALIEKESKLGGCWKVEWKNNKYFTEHSPRVLMENNSGLFKLFKLIGFNYKKETLPTYGNLLETNNKFINFFSKNLEITDYFKILNGLFYINSNLTVTEWMNKLKLSKKAQKALTIFSILIANSPDKLLISELFIVNNFPVMFLQFIDNEKWINLLENKLIKQNVDIYKNYELKKLIYHSNSNKIKQSIIKYTKNINFYNQKIMTGKNHIITFPPKAMYDFLIHQPQIIRNNWNELKGNKLTKWLKESTYYSFGFQLHFKQSKIDNPKLDLTKKKWCWSCFNDYNLIIIPTSDFTKISSKDSKIQTVWSCTIVDTNVLIKKFNKTVNQMSRDEIINDVLKELYKFTNTYPTYVTFYDGLKKEKINNQEQWISKDSAFSVGKSGIVKSKGKITNLEWIGPHNKTGITVINKAIDIAIDWCKNNKFNIYNLDQKTDYFKGILIIIVFITIIIWYYKNK